ncbi:hypothetical protein [Erwinia typographi]|uniref:hypothetical protein n=1 Tax=Erwinia typographi TaxID=371042 RepID=UPI000A863603|nr:hypothetical protein [Erwinia typographi]
MSFQIAKKGIIMLPVIFYLWPIVPFFGHKLKQPAVLWCFFVAARLNTGRDDLIRLTV